MLVCSKQFPTLLLLTVLMSSCIARSVDLRRAGKSNRDQSSVLPHDSQLRKDGILDRIRKQPTQSPGAFDDMSGNALNSVKDVVVEENHQELVQPPRITIATLPPHSSQPQERRLTACAPRLRTVKFNRFSCRGTAVIHVCEGACTTTVKTQRRRHPFLTTISRSCSVTSVKKVHMNLTCSPSSLERMRRRREEGRLDDQTWAWLRGPKTLLSATSCACTACS